MVNYFHHEAKWRKFNKARFAAVDLPREKRVEIGLTYIYGLGRVSSKKILEQADKQLKKQEQFWSADIRSRTMN